MICLFYFCPPDTHHFECIYAQLSEFDEDNAEGRQLNADLRALKAASLPDKILVEVKFPQDFPRHPFSLRIVRPRFQMYTGHITAGGSVCIQALTTGSSSGDNAFDNPHETLNESPHASFQRF
jgi:hypothetical protein